MATSDSTRTSLENSGGAPLITSELILSQLERILSSPAFCRSSRYSRFLRFIVEQTVLGHSNELKERLIGIEVFDRSSDYDLGNDSIVRVAAGEVRRRLRQYYAENASRNELRIRLEAGSYVPEFQLQPTLMPETGSDITTAKYGVDHGALKMSEARPVSRRTKAAIFSLILSVALFSVGLLYMSSRPMPLEYFWDPFTHSGGTTIICMGSPDDTTLYPSLAMRTSQSAGANNSNHLILGDVQAMNLFSNILVKHGVQVMALSSGATSLAELRKHPAILVGGGSNKWTMREMPLLRYQLMQNLTPGVNGIRDRDNQSNLRWKVDFNVPFDSMSKTYAIVARFVDPVTDQPIAIIDGLGAAGTLAAADFLTDPKYFDDFVAHAPKGWENHNLEIVLEVRLIEGNYDPPRVVASYSW